MVTDEGETKILEFGLCFQVDDSNLHGTPFYMAPELIRGSFHSKQSDVWALGVLLYIFLSGFMPFPANNKQELFDKIDSGKVSFHHEEFEQVSPEAKDLI